VNIGGGAVLKKYIASLFVVAVLCFPFRASAQEGLAVAVAANFIKPFEEISVLFEKLTGIRVEATYTSTGKLYAQIVQGAPYDVFLAADEKRPALLFSENLSEKPFVYARGQIVLFSANKDICKSGHWKQAVVNKEVGTIAVANTEGAPYGTAAMIALKDAGLWDQLEMKYVFPQTIAQVFQYASTGSVDAGFCAYSSALSDEGKAGCFLVVEEAPSVIQAACVLKRTENKDQAEEACRIKERYGYR